MREALFINGVFESVLEEILAAQNNYPEKIFYLQPHASQTIKMLKSARLSINKPVPLYISTTKQLDQICYVAEIINWEEKSKLTQEDINVLNKYIKKFQPNEEEIYLEIEGKKCVNLISIKKLIKVTNQISVKNLIKISDGKPIKPRTRAGGWSYVRPLSLLSIKETIVEENLKKEFEKSVAKSLEDSDESRKRRLIKANKYPEKIQTLSYGYRRNADVVAEVLKKANGKCSLCQANAPFLKESNGEPYLEVHHWIPLSENGKDTVDNACALCPNCHKQAHFGKYKNYISKTQLERFLLLKTLSERVILLIIMKIHAKA